MSSLSDTYMNIGSERTRMGREGWQGERVREKNGGCALTVLTLLLLSLIALILNTHSAQVHVSVCKMTTPSLEIRHKETLLLSQTSICFYLLPTLYLMVTRVKLNDDDG